MNKVIKENLSEILEYSFQNSSQGIYLLNMEGNILYANKSALDTLEYTLDEIKQLSVWDIDLNVDAEQKYFNYISGVSDDNTHKYDNKSIESYYRRKNNSIFPVEINSKLIPSSYEKIVVAYVRDISNRLKRMEEINFYFDLINSSNDLIFLVNYSSGLIEFVNEAVTRLLGYNLSELRGMEVSLFRQPMPGKEHITITEIYEKIKKSKNLTTVGIYITKDGREIPVETSLRLQEYKNEKYIIGISRDISERVEIEAEKEKLNKKLKKYNETLTKEIEKAKNDLVEYEDIMKRQSKMAAMGEMLENIAHQWRQPLSAASVLATGMIVQNEEDMLNKDILNTGLNDINEHIQYLSKTIDDFRNFFKPTKQKNCFELSSLIERAIKLLKAKYINYINFVIDVDNIKISTYENELLQVILNLISNAKDELIKKEYDGYIFIDAKIESAYVKINIKDNAGGIDPFIIDRIFEPYFTTKHNYQGTGIGLYMSENIIKHLQGSIKVKNIDVKCDDIVYSGACFEIMIPLDLKG